MIPVKVAYSYKQIQAPLVGEHAFPVTGFVCDAGHVTFGGSGGIMVETSISEVAVIL